MASVAKNCDTCLQDYTLIRFIHRGKKRKIEDIDVVPTDWLFVSKKRTTTQFLDSPIEEEDGVLLQELVKNKTEPPSDWPTFNVQIIGRAKNYKEACEKLENLKKNETVLTCESNEEPEDVERNMMLAIRRNQLARQQKLLRGEVTQSNSNVSDQPCEKSVLETSQSDLTETNKVQTNIGDLDVETISVKEMSDSTFSIDENSDAYQVIANLDLPIYNVNNDYVHQNDFERIVLKQLDSLNTRVQKIEQHQEKMERFIMDKKVVAIVDSKIDFEKKYDLKFPLASMLEFLKFEKLLCDNTFLKHDIISCLSALIKQDLNMSKSYAIMLKKFLSKDVALRFTAARVSSLDPTKFVMKNTSFGQCLDCVIQYERGKAKLQTYDKELNSALSDVLSNVKHWKS